MKKYILLLLCSVILFSCNQDERPQQTYGFIFYPRDCNYAWMDLSELVNQTIDNHNYVLPQYFAGGSINPTKLLVNIRTSNFSRVMAVDSIVVYHDTIYKTLGEHSTQIEKQIDDNYTRTHQSESVGGLSTPSPLEIEYRLTEVKNLTISSNVTLFGQAAGSSLNSYIEIHSITPEFIFSAQDRLLMGFDQWEEMKGMSISQWLNMHPLAAASMSLQFKTVPSEAPVDAQIILKMEMAGGAVLRDTSSMITLLP